ncbi:MAG TPA: tyrosine-type recombinase/integrase [Gemmatimonadaceae bacterium]
MADADGTAPRDRPPAFLTEFLNGRSPLTARRYLAALRQFAQWRECAIGVAIDEFLSTGAHEARRTAWRYRTALIERGRAPSTINVGLAALVCVARAARYAGMIDWSLEVEPLRIQSYRDTRGPGIEGVRALLDAAMRREPEQLRARDVCMLTILFGLALRRSELLGLDVGSLERRKNGAPIGVWIRGKARNADERLTLPIGAQRALTAWLAVRGTAPGPLFVSLAARHRRAHARLSGDGLAHILRELSAEADLEKYASPHSIRHSAITQALASNDVNACAALSRHRNLSTLVIYDDARRDAAGKVATYLDDLLG